MCLVLRYRETKQKKCILIIIIIRAAIYKFDSLYKKMMLSNYDLFWCEEIICLNFRKNVFDVFILSFYPLIYK